MTNSIDEIKAKLDALYADYNRSGNKLGKGKTLEAADQILRISYDGSPDAVIGELSRFSRDVCKEFFDKFTKAHSNEISVIDDLITLFAESGILNSRAAITKMTSAVIGIYSGHSECFMESLQLPVIINQIAKAPLARPELIKRFKEIVCGTKGEIFALDYSPLARHDLGNIWALTKDTISELPQFADKAEEWADNNGFLKSELHSSTAESKVTPVSVSAEAAVPQNDSTLSSQNEVSSSERKLSTTDSALRGVIREEQTVILSKLEVLLRPVQTSLKKLEDSSRESERLLTENTKLREHIHELELQLHSAEQRVAAEHAAAVSLSTDNSALEAKITELDAKLREAYSINSREASLEAERLRDELSKSLSFCYEDWREYEEVDCSDDNYESLKAIIRRVFRVLEKNHISIKGKNE